MASHHASLPVVLVADVVMHMQQACWVVLVVLAICAMLCPGRCASWHTHQRAKVTQQSVAMGLQVTCTCHTHIGWKQGNSQKSSKHAATAQHITTQPSAHQVVCTHGTLSTQKQHRLSVQAAIISLRTGRADKCQIKPQTADNLPISVR